jgi:hypothetical protein
MKTFNQFCSEAYQLDEFIKPIAKKLLRGTAVGTGIGAVTDKATSLFPKQMQPGVKKVIDVASWGPLAPAAGAVQMYQDAQQRKERDRQASRAQSSSLPSGSRWYGKPEDDIRPKRSDDPRLLAKGRYITRNYQGVGTQRP